MQTGAPIKKNDVLEIEIDGIGYEGEGIAHLGGYTVFIRYALPGEKVRAVVILVKPTFAVAKLQQVLRVSPDRATPFCPVYYRCGGCGLQHMTYDAQLRFKQNAVREAFRKTARMDIEPCQTVPSPRPTFYRNKMSLPVRGDDAQTGFFATGSHRLVPIEECPIQFDGNGELIGAFRAFMHKNDLRGYNETERTGDVRHLSVRQLGDFRTVTVVTNGNRAKQLAPFNAVLEELYGNKYAYYLNENTSAGNRILGEKSVLAGGELAPVTVDGLQVSVHPHAFFQVNDGVRQKLYAAAAEHANSHAAVDAYSGAGILSALLARKASAVLGVEIETAAVRSAQDMAARNGIQNVTFVCDDCAEALPRLPQAFRGQNTVVVLDPPRAGCDRRVLAALSAACPAKIVYISCNPATLARDVSLLTQSGFALSSVTPFDMFPQTAGVETLCVLTR